MKRKLTSEVDRRMVISHIEKLDLQKTYTVEVTEKKPRRTISQNSLYWLWVNCIAYETGNDADDLHEHFKRKYLTPEIVVLFGEQHERYSTTKLNTIQFKYLLDKVQAFANTDLGIELPDPDDRHFEEFYRYYIDR